MPEIVKLTDELTDWLGTLNDKDIQDFTEAVEIATKALLTLAGLSVLKQGVGIANTVGKGLMGIGAALSPVAAGGEAAAAVGLSTLIPGIGEVVVGVLAVAGVAAAAYGLYEYIKDKDKDNIDRFEIENGQLVKKKRIEEKSWTEQISDRFNHPNEIVRSTNYDIPLSTKTPTMTDEAALFWNHLKSINIDPKKHGDKFQELLGKKENLQTLADLKNAELQHKDLKTLTDILKPIDEQLNYQLLLDKNKDIKDPLKALEAFEKKYLEKVKGESNKQFIININGALVEQKDFTFNNSQENAQDVEKIIIDSIMKSLNALPAYAH
jgi:hypothetical protein